MADGQEREWLVYLDGQAGVVQVRVRSTGAPVFNGNEVTLGDCVFASAAFLGAFPFQSVVHDVVRASGGK